MERPTREKVFINHLNKEVVLNFITLRDDEWMKERFSEDTLTKAFTADGFNLDVIFSFFWRMLSVEDKKMMLAAKIYEESGMEVRELTFEDPIKKLYCIISGQGEISAIIAAIVNTRVKSNPVIAESLKKKALSSKPVSESTPGPSPST